VQTCGQCGDRWPTTLANWQRREHPVQGIHVPGVGTKMGQSGAAVVGLAHGKDKEMKKKMGWLG
jgi:hypothetical protein